MDSSSTDAAPQAVSVIDYESFEDYLPLAQFAVQSVGPAAQTLGALYVLVDGKTRSTFASVSKISDRAVVPIGTIRDHLRTLCEFGYVRHCGRDELRKRGRRRRTVTYKIDDGAMVHKKPYGMLPRWAAASLPKWSYRAVFAAVVSRYWLKENMEAGSHLLLDGRECMSINEAMRETGLTNHSVIDAFDYLRGQGIIHREPHADRPWLGHVAWLDADYEIPPTLLGGANLNTNETSDTDEVVQISTPPPVQISTPGSANLNTLVIQKPLSKQNLIQTHTRCRVRAPSLIEIEKKKPTKQEPPPDRLRKPPPATPEQLAEADRARARIEADLAALEETA